MEKEEKNNWGGAREGAGRPPLSEEKRTHNIGIRVTESELLMFKEKAQKYGMKLTDFLVELVKKA